MATFIRPRNDPPKDEKQTPVVPLAIALAALGCVILLLVGVLFYMRRMRRLRAMRQLPLYNEKRNSSASTNSSHRRVMNRPTAPIYVMQEKECLMRESAHPPDSPLPEIRITFPEEYDASGKRTSGRCVVVRMGEQGGVGLEPLGENLPAYTEKEGERFHSLDLDRIGGLVEKARNASAR